MFSVCLLVRVSHALIGAMPVCCMCKASIDGENKCDECNATRSRITRLLAANSALEKDFNPETMKPDLYQDAKGLYGDDLKKVVTDSLKRT